MFKSAFVTSFILSLGTYAAFAWLQPAAPPGPPEMMVIFGFWFGLSVLLGWGFKRTRQRRTGHAS